MSRPSTLINQGSTPTRHTHVTHQSVVEDTRIHVKDFFTIFLAESVRVPSGTSNPLKRKRSAFCLGRSLPRCVGRFHDFFSTESVPSRSSNPDVFAIYLAETESLGRQIPLPRCVGRFYDFLSGIGPRSVSDVEPPLARCEGRFYDFSSGIGPRSVAKDVFYDFLSGNGPRFVSDVGPPFPVVKDVFHDFLAESVSIPSRTSNPPKDVIRFFLAETE